MLCCRAAEINAGLSTSYLWTSLLGTQDFANGGSQSILRTNGDFILRNCKKFETFQKIHYISLILISQNVLVVVLFNFQLSTDAVNVNLQK